MGKSKIQALTAEWYGFTVFVFLVNVLLAIFGSGIFAVVTVPFVIGVSVISLLITWGIGALLLRRSSLTRVVLLVLSPLAFLGGCVSAWQLVTGPWSLGMIFTTLVVIGAIYMHGRSFLTLLDKDVSRYFR